MRRYAVGMQKIDINPLAQIMRQLRDPETGCPWDVQQDFASIAPYTIEEAYEVADAIERSDMDALKDELGDLLLQVVFHSQMASESGSFDLADVIQSICDKMIRRHPHVFGNGSAEGADAVVTNWEAIKASERSDKEDDSSALAGVANALPALLRAQKLQKRASRVGFDWDDSNGPKAKIAEETAEVEEAEGDAAIEEEIGDLIFAAVNYARHLNVDAEAAVKKANRKFENRFRAMEEFANGNEDFTALTMKQKEALWQKAKRATKPE